MGGLKLGKTLVAAPLIFRAYCVVSRVVLCSFYHEGHEEQEEIGIIKEKLLY